MLHIGNSNYIRGKRLRIEGKKLPPLPKRGTHSQTDCDLRSGWRVADTIIATHPDWTQEQILA